MGPEEIAKYQRDQVEMKTLYFEQPEVKGLMETVSRLVDEAHKQAAENTEERS